LEIDDTFIIIRAKSLAEKCPQTYLKLTMEMSRIQPISAKIVRNYVFSNVDNEYDTFEEAQSTLFDSPEDSDIEPLKRLYYSKVPKLIDKLCVDFKKATGIPLRQVILLGQFMHASRMESLDGDPEINQDVTLLFGTDDWKVDDRFKDIQWVPVITGDY